jgi:beta-mannosidase
VHSDLLTAGAMPDPYLDANEREAAWVGRTDRRYDAVMATPPTGHERTDLVFDGLDTFAEITLGGRLLGRTANMHRSYRYDVTAASAQEALLSVRFASAHNEAERLRDELGARPNALPEPFNYVR